MNLTSYPADYSSAFDKNNLYCFDCGDATAPTEITFYDGDGVVIGARRYAPSEKIAASPESFLRRLLNPHPHTNVPGCRIFHAPDREVAIAVGYNDNANRTPLVHYTASLAPLALHAVMGGDEQWRSIAAGEWDEVAFRVENGEKMTAVCHFPDGIGDRTLVTNTAQASGLHILSVDADVALVSKPTAESFDVVLSVGGVEIATLHYEVAAAAPKGVRIAWLNSEGYISYHTFRTVLAERLQAVRSEYETASGTLTLAVESWREMTLRSDFLSSDKEEWLSELAASPKVWRIDSRRAVPQSITSHSVVFAGDGARSVELTLRPARKVSRF